MKHDNTVIGKSLPMRDAFDKVTGRATYIADIDFPDMLYAKVAGSLYPHAIVKGINVEKIRAIPGVKVVLTKKDLTETKFGSNFTRPAYPIHDHARCIGDVIAAVAAENEEAAENAIEQIEVQYDVMPAIFDSQEAMKSSAPKLFPEGNITDSGGGPEVLEYGDVEKGFKEADFTIESTFRMPKVLHAAMEPRACVAKWNEDKLLVWVTSQTPHYVRRFLAEYFDMPLLDVSVNVRTFGGGFGGKYQEEYILLTSLLAKKAAQPVKLVYTRDMESMVGRSRYGAVSTVKFGVKEDGTITALDVHQCYDVGAYGIPDSGSGATMGAVNASIYKTENCRIRAWNVCTNTTTAQKFRSVYVPTYRFAAETLMDMIEERLGKEPGQLRLEKTVKAGEAIMPYGNIMGDHAMHLCLEKAKEAADWSEKWKGWRKPVAVKDAKHTGIGIGFGVGWCDWYRERHGGTSVELYPDGKIILTTGVTDIGTGNLTTISQIVAEILGFSSIERVEVRAPNTSGIEREELPYDEGTIASRVLFVGGWAAKLAASQVREELLTEAANELEQDPSRIEISDSVIYDKERPQQRIRLGDLIKQPILGSAVPPAPKVVGRAKRYREYVAPVEVHIAEVEIDTETWETTVVNYVAAHDIGRAINPRIVVNQIEGGVIQGISTALYEELVFDRGRNAYSNPDFVDYKLATINDIPAIKAALVEDAPAAYGPFGAKGIGEHPLPPVYGAIANAVYNAVGIRPKELPITPERMLRWWQERENHACSRYS